MTRPLQLSDRARRRLPWAVPVVVVGAAVATFALTSGNASGASPSLPSRTPAQLIAAVAKSDTTALSGTVQESADLGLPSLPGGTSSASLSWQSFVTGSHTARVWVDGADKQRVALLGQLSESDVVHNGSDVWTYSSQSNSVSHRTLRTPAEKRDADRSVPTPSALATRALDAVTPTTSVTVSDTQVVAGRDAYTLTLAPKDSRSTVSRVSIAVDASTYVPLQVQVFGSGSSPAFSVGFSSISYATPAASTFAFHAPAGATVAKDPFGTGSRSAHHDQRLGQRHGASSAPSGPTTIGSGWTSVVRLGAPAGHALSGGVLRDASTPIGSTGSRLVHTALVNAVVRSDGQVFVGAVTASVLEHIAATSR